ncbi:MAG TPA: thioredoxin family protein [Candidatus Methylomirabilis sp.]|nr:thioredoxin family protein [Candidatus Methylomirabilis sp.]
MRKITVYGPGCMKCQRTEAIVRQVVAETGVEAVVEHVTDMQAIAAAGILSTPAVAVDGLVKLKGRVPTAEEVRQLLGGCCSGAAPARPGGTCCGG